MNPGRHDVLVVGAGPAGASAAYWLANRGYDVCVVERFAIPRDKVCGDGLTPRAVRQLHDMGLADAMTAFHRYDSLRVAAHGTTLEMAWPEHPDFPAFGYVARRSAIDEIVMANAVAAGVTLHESTEAVAPVVQRGMIRGATVRQEASGVTTEIRAKYVVIADGAASNFGRMVGTTRDRNYPLGLAVRGYYASARSNEHTIESGFDLRDREGKSLPGYGWVFPLGDGTLNVGVGLMSTFRDWKSVNNQQLLREYTASIAASWHIDPDRPLSEPIGGRLPMGGSISPKSGPTFLVVGDAAGTVNPFNGEGIDYAYETGRLAADVLHLALSTNDATALATYEPALDDRYLLYFKVARLFSRIIGQPAAMRELTRVGMHSRTLMEWALAIMSNMLRPDESGPAEKAYAAIESIVRRLPEP